MSLNIPNRMDLNYFLHFLYLFLTLGNYRFPLALFGMDYSLYFHPFLQIYNHNLQNCHSNHLLCKILYAICSFLGKIIIMHDIYLHGNEIGLLFLLGINLYVNFPKFFIIYSLAFIICPLLYHFLHLYMLLHEMESMMDLLLGCLSFFIYLFFFFYFVYIFICFLLFLLFICF